MIELFCDKVKQVFQSEESMTSYWLAKFKIDFDRTKHGQSLVRSIHDEVAYDLYKMVPSQFDRNKLAHDLCVSNLLDYNLCSQVALNLQAPMFFNWDRNKLTMDIEACTKTASDAGTPQDLLSKVAKLDKSESSWTPAYNKLVNLVATQKIVNAYNQNSSWRLSACGQTPALADSHNMSMLRMDSIEYIRPLEGFKVCQLGWEGTRSVDSVSTSDGGLDFEGIPYTFYSKSGGDMLGQFLYVRKKIVKLLAHPNVYNVIPRLNSLTIVYKGDVLTELETIVNE